MHCVTGALPVGYEDSTAPLFHQSLNSLAVNMLCNLTLCIILQGVEFWHSPLTKAVAVNTVLLRYRAPVIIITQATVSV